MCYGRSWWLDDDDGSKDKRERAMPFFRDKLDGRSSIIWVYGERDLP